MKTTTPARPRYRMGLSRKGKWIEQEITEGTENQQFRENVPLTTWVTEKVLFLVATNSPSVLSVSLRPPARRNRSTLCESAIALVLWKMCLRVSGRLPIYRDRWHRSAGDTGPESRPGVWRPDGKGLVRYA